MRVSALIGKQLMGASPLKGKPLVGSLFAVIQTAPSLMNARIKRLSKKNLQNFCFKQTHTMHTLIPTIESLTQAAVDIDNDAPSEAFLGAIIERGYLRPSEDESLGYFARFPNIRDALRDTINEALKYSKKTIRQIKTDEDWRLIMIGYAATCTLIRLDRLLLLKIAEHSIIQRKLNEEFDEQIDHVAQHLERYESSLDSSRRNYIKRIFSYVNHKRRRRSVVRHEQFISACDGE